MLVSVVIPTYNRSQLIPKAINCVLSQTYKNIEIIIVSDGSTDNTDSVVKEFQQEYSNIKYISYHPNRGGNYARNEGIKRAKGEYIAFLDDDDEWELDKIELQVSEFKEKPEIGLVYTKAKIIYQDLNISYYTQPKKSGDLSKEIMMNNLIGSTSSVMVKTEALLKTDLFDEGLSALQDYDLWIRLCQLVKVNYINKPLLNYYNNLSIEQISDDVEKYKNALKFIKKKYSIYFDNDEKLNNAFNLFSNILISNKYMRKNKRIKARKYLKKQSIKNKKIFPLYILTFFNYKVSLRLKNIITKK